LHWFFLPLFFLRLEEEQSKSGRWDKRGTRYLVYPTGRNTMPDVNAMLARLNGILRTPTKTEKTQESEQAYECPECGAPEPKKLCRVRHYVCCPKCGAR
jgi:hypothetical protein